MIRHFNSTSLKIVLDFRILISLIRSSPLLVPQIKVISGVHLDAFCNIQSFLHGVFTCFI